MNKQETQERIEDIKETIAIYERNITCLEACDWKNYERLCEELKELEALS